MSNIFLEVWIFKEPLISCNLEVPKNQSPESSKAKSSHKIIPYVRLLKEMNIDNLKQSPQKKCSHSTEGV